MWGTFRWDQRLIVNHKVRRERDRVRQRKRERETHSFPLGTVPSWRQLRIQKKKSTEIPLTSGGWPWPAEEQCSLLVNDFQRCCTQTPRCFLRACHSGRKARQAARESDFYTDCTEVWGWILDRGFSVEGAMWGRGRLWWPSINELQDTTIFVNAKMVVLGQPGTSLCILEFPNGCFFLSTVFPTVVWGWQGKYLYSHVNY